MPRTLARLTLLVTLVVGLGAVPANAAVRTLRPVDSRGGQLTFDLRPTAARDIAATTLLAGGRSYRVDAGRVRADLHGGRVRVQLVRRAGRRVTVVRPALRRTTAARAPRAARAGALRVVTRSSGAAAATPAAASETTPVRAPAVELASAAPAPGLAPMSASAPSPVPSTERLTWAAPALAQPVELRIDSNVIRARGSNKWTLDNTRDYRVTLGDVSTTLGGVVFSGGRNVVVMGGHITVPWAGASPTIEARRALFFYRQVGTVHLEGTLIDNAGGDLSEGIQIDAPSAIVQIQNVRVTGIHARDQVHFSDNHPDLIQPYGGVRELRVDRFTGSTDSQGIFLRAAYAPIGKVDLRRVNMIGTNANATRIFHHFAGETGTIPTRLTDVWVTPQPGDSLYSSVLAETAAGTVYTQTMTAGGLTATWPNYKDASGNLVISGAIRAGVPTTGEWVPAARVGAGYVSPGYL
jgi:hypothetical protein